MKRHQSLHPLSRDHHRALVQARALGLAAGANGSNHLDRTAAGFTAYWENELREHFSLEERIVLPLLARYTAQDGDEIGEIFRQHIEITQRAVELIDKRARQETIEVRLLAELGELLRLHIRYEEAKLFPALERSASEEELQRMGEQLEAEKSRAGHPSCSL